jgi:hypothetical protein
VQVIGVFELLGWSLALGATAAGIIEALRELAPVQRAMLRRQKPWACDICMSFWTTGALTALLAWGNDVRLALAAGPAYPVALLFLAKLGEPRQPPPELPPLT